MVSAVVEQLLDYCECIKDIDKDEAVLERNVEELLNLISINTCWSREPCETLLNSPRQEYIDVGEIKKCSCEGGIVTFTPYYYPFNPDSFEVTLVRIEGIKEELTPISEDDWAYISSEGDLRIDLSEYVTNDRCGCKAIYKLAIDYDAGFEEIPDCLLKVFCDMLHIIFAKNTCDCSVCQSCKASGTDTLIEFDEDDTISQKIDSYLTNFLWDAYRDQLSLISLCGRDINDSNVWGVVI